MKCDLCSHRDLNEVFVLRKFKFSKYAPKKTQKARRVCWECAKHLFRRKLYNFGHNWRMVFLDSSLIQEQNKDKYLVIHA